MTTWPIKKLGEICDFIPGFSFKAGDFNDKGLGMSVIRTGDINNLKETEKFYDGLYQDDYVVETGDVLIGLSGTIISGVWQGPKALLNQRVVKLENFTDADKKFVAYVLPRILRKLSEELNKSAVKNVLKHHLENLQIPLPPLPIQQKIVRVLDAVRSAMDAQEKIIELAKELKKSMMANIFNSKVKTQNSKLQFKIQKWVKLGDNCQLRKEQCLPKANDKYVGLEHLDSGEVMINRYGGGSEVKSSKNKFYPGDILYGKLRPYLDKAAIANFEGVCSTDLLVLACDKTKILPEYLINIVHLPNFLNFAISTTSGTNHPRTSWDALKTFLLPLPLLSEQCEIAGILQTVDQKIEIEQKKKALYEELFWAMLEQLMTGKIRVNNLEFQ